MLIKLTPEPLRQMLALAQPCDIFPYSHGVLVSPHPTGSGALLMQSNGFYLTAWHDAKAEITCTAQSIFFPKDLAYTRRNPTKYIAAVAQGTIDGKVILRLDHGNSYLDCEGQRDDKSEANLSQIHLTEKNRSDMVAQAKFYPEPTAFILQEQVATLNQPDNIYYASSLLKKLQNFVGLESDILLLGKSDNATLLFVSREQPVCAFLKPLPQEWQNNKAVTIPLTNLSLAHTARQPEIRQRFSAISGIVIT